MEGASRRLAVDFAVETDVGVPKLKVTRWKAKAFHVRANYEFKATALS